MAKKKGQPVDNAVNPASLRARAEAMMRASRTDIASMPLQDVQSLVHELQVHQIELEIQNEELRRAQLELSESRDRYADLYEFAPVGYVTLDKNSRIVEANLAAANLLGVERGKLVGAKLTDYIVREGQDDFHLHRRSVNASDLRQVCELPMRGADGCTLFVRLKSIRILPSVDSQVVCRTALVDVTAQRLAENELRRINNELDERVKDRTAELMQTLGDLQEEVVRRRDVEEHLRREVEMSARLVETAQVVIVLLNVDGRIVMFNDYMANLCGYALAEVKGKDWFETFLPHEDRVPMRERFAGAISGTPTRGNVNTIITKDGRHRQIEWFDAKLTDSEGNLAGLLCAGQDITARLEGEIALRESREWLAAVLNTAVDAIVTIDQRGTIVDCNHATQAIFGYTEKELIGQNVNLLMPSPYHEEHDQYLANYLRTGDGKIIGIGREVVGRRKDGSQFPADLGVSRFHDKSQWMFTGIIRDISERKSLEKRLAEARFDEQRHIAQELHDGLGGQLTGIGMLAKTLSMRLKREQSPLAEAADGLLAHIRDAHGLLRKLARGLHPVEVTPDGLQAALAELASTIRAGGKVECDLKCQDNLLIHSPLHATHLFRIAQEAVTNAVRHAAPTHIGIELSTDGHLVTLRVRDDGVGIKGSSDSHGGLGLHTMEYRASQIGAKLSVIAGESGGTIVTCRYPNGSTVIVHHESH